MCRERDRYVYIRFPNIHVLLIYFPSVAFSRGEAVGGQYLKNICVGSPERATFLDSWGYLGAGTSSCACLK